MDDLNSRSDHEHSHRERMHENPPQIFRLLASPHSSTNQERQNAAEAIGESPSQMFHTVPLRATLSNHSPTHPPMTEPRMVSWAADALPVLLIPLPFLLASLLEHPPLAVQHHHTATEIVEEIASEALPIAFRVSSMIHVCTITSGTLLCMGLAGRLRLGRETSFKRSSRYLEGAHIGLATLRLLVVRILTVGLPFLATIELGGARAASIIATFVASGLALPEVRASQDNASWLATLKRYKLTLGGLLVSLVLDLLNLGPNREAADIVRGYLALLKSALLLCLPLPTSLLTRRSDVIKTSSKPPASSRVALAAPFPDVCSNSPILFPLCNSYLEADLTVASGCLLGVITAFLRSTAAVAPNETVSIVVFYCLIIGFTTTLYSIRLRTLRRVPYSLGLLSSMALCVGFTFVTSKESSGKLSLLLVTCAVFYVAALLEAPYNSERWQTASGRGADESVNAQTHCDRDRLQSLHQVDDDHHHKHTHHHGIKSVDVSRVTRLLIARTKHISILQTILKEKESRRIVYFMSLNLAFMCVQTFYALLSSSLGLLSDSIHMFFDCMGLLAGLLAAIMSKWPSSSKFPYGYGKVETLSGLGNGIFLIIISVEIIWESFERFMEGAPLQHLVELLLVSIAGLAVNILGLMCIPHAHHHSHGAGHDHDHSNENMHGIWLHILADTMGSVAVIVSTLLTWYTGWAGWDPLASFIIAILIIAASLPLVTGSAKRLLLTIPNETEYSLRSTLQELSDLRGVIGYAAPRFWIEEGHEWNDHDHQQLHHDSHHHDHHDYHHSPTDHHHHQHCMDGQSSEHMQEYSKHGRSHEGYADHSHHQVLNRTDHAYHTRPHHDDHHHGPGEPHHPGHDPRLSGMVHVIASRASDLEDLRCRVEDFFRARFMLVTVQIEREGSAHCWCRSQSQVTGSAKLVNI